MNFQWSEIEKEEIKALRNRSLLDIEKTSVFKLATREFVPVSVRLFYLRE